MLTTGITDSGVQIVVSGLKLWLDAAQKRSYSGSGAFWYELIPVSGFTDLYNTPSFSTNNGGYFTFSSPSYANNTLSSTLTTWTASLWIKTPSSYDGNDHFALGNQLGGGIILSGAGGGGGLDTGKWGIYDGSERFVTANQLSTNTWYNISATRSGDTYELYQDGVFDSSSSLYTGQNFSEFWIGVNNGFTNYFPYPLANVLIYDSVLNATGHLQNFKAIRSRFGK